MSSVPTEQQPLGVILQLLDWSETKRGMRVVFEVMEAPDNPFANGNPFKLYTSKNGKVAGQFFAAALVEIDPGTERPVGEATPVLATPPAAAFVAPRLPPKEAAAAPSKPPPDPQPFDSLSAKKQSVILARDPHFQEFVAMTSLYAKSEDQAAEYIREACGITSRAQLNYSTLAQTKFARVRDAFNAWQADQLKHAMRVSK
jgi:hypothetical protein